ncbi:hypothetical protein BC940DRAFT_311198 [Gongronella butleri]|nr:hypothetical protein BC940DRAFT_311198 [Gongronella butleri]
METPAPAAALGAPQASSSRRTTVSDDLDTVMDGHQPLLVHETSENNNEAAPPLFVERTRQQFSYDSSELRRRTTTAATATATAAVAPAPTATKDDERKTAPTPTTTTAGPAHTVHASEGGFYECNICFDTASHPVLTLCGHLFCWSCLAQWLNAQSRNPTCPVCKAGCGKDKVIPIYGRGKEEKDPRNDPSIPTRPAGQRPPPLRDPNRPNTSFFGQNMRGAYHSRNVTFTGGIGFFPFGISFNFPATGGGGALDPQMQSQQNAFMSRLFLMVLSLIIVAIIFS